MDELIRDANHLVATEINDKIRVFSDVILAPLLRAGLQNMGIDKRVFTVKIPDYKDIEINPDIHVHSTKHFYYMLTLSLRKLNEEGRFPYVLSKKGHGELMGELKPSCLLGDWQNTGEPPSLL